MKSKTLRMISGGLLFVAAAAFFISGNTVLGAAFVAIGAAGDRCAFTLELRDATTLSSH